MSLKKGGAVMAKNDSKTPVDASKPFDHELVGSYKFLVPVEQEGVRDLLLKARAYSRWNISTVDILDNGNLLISFEFGKVASAGAFIGPGDAQG